MSQIPQEQSPFALHPTIFVIFGITGDLASRKLLPSLLSLYSKKLLPPRFTVVGFSRRNFSKEEFREYIRGRLNISPGQFKEEDIKHFLDHIVYEQGFFDDVNSYNSLSERLSEIDMKNGQCSNKLIHLAVPANLYEGILLNIAHSKLNVPCADEIGWTRILIEKPFGEDIQNAQRLDKLLGKLFKEEQIFRIDHYLAKETLQNIIAFRFSNTIFEPLWNNKHIDKIHIKLFEKNGVEGRGASYDSMGALKDVGQNHLLQMLALIAMNKPKTFDAKEIRKERSRLLSKLIPINEKVISKHVVRGQYMGYRAISGVKNESDTETYFRIEAYIDNPKWTKVPFYIESGKAMHETKTSIDIYFRNEDDEMEQNILTFRIQPDEGIKIRFFVKTPGYEFKVEPKTLRFSYTDISNFLSTTNDYERLIHDAFVGDQTLFPYNAVHQNTYVSVSRSAGNFIHKPCRKIYIARNI
jgi:glucose-6-phosphate 1-dehydrogenase